MSFLRCSTHLRRMALAPPPRPYIAEDVGRVALGAGMVVNEFVRLHAGNTARATSNFMTNNQDVRAMWESGSLHSAHCPTRAHFPDAEAIQRSVENMLGQWRHILRGDHAPRPPPHHAHPHPDDPSPHPHADIPPVETSPPPRERTHKSFRVDTDTTVSGVAGSSSSGTASVPSTVPPAFRQERRVPSSSLARALGFGGIAARVALGTVADAAKRTLSPSSSSSSAHGADGGTVHDPPTNGVLGQFMSETNVERVAAGLCRMRGAALKVGQMFSIQDPSLVPPQLAAILERVRDQADVMPRSQLLKVLSTELGPDWQDKLKSFDMEPIASASIGQVHRAQLHDGTHVAMKIQYPGVAKSVHSDLANLKRLVQLMAFLPKGLYLDESTAAAEEELLRECDYENEARNQMKYRELLKNEKDIEVPRVIEEFSTKRILTSELIHGIPINKLAEKAKDVPEFDQVERNRVAQLLLKLCLREMFEFGFMQTDPNWSNFLYNTDTGVVYLIDFGAARDYSDDFMRTYLRMVHACAARDERRILDYSKQLGFLTGMESKETLDAHVAASYVVGEPFASNEPFDFVAGNLAERTSRYAKTLINGRLTPPPQEAYSLHRKLSGAFLSCRKLEAVISCRPMFMEFFKTHSLEP